MEDIICISDNDGEEVTFGLDIRATSFEESDPSSSEVTGESVGENSNSSSSAPLYNSEFLDYITENPLEVKKVEQTSTRGNGQSCFNCDGDHMINDCPLPRDQKKINSAVKVFRRNNQNQNTKRYHVTGSQQQGTPGRISSDLRNALGITGEQLPPHVYRMRSVGYPPGWRLHAKEVSSGLRIIDDAESSLVKKTKKRKRTRTRYNPDQIYDYPGFNSRPPDQYIDVSRLSYTKKRRRKRTRGTEVKKQEWQKYGVRPYTEEYSKEKCVERWVEEDEISGRRMRRASESSTTSSDGFVEEESEYTERRKTKRTRLGDEASETMQHYPVQNSCNVNYVSGSTSYSGQYPGMVQPSMMMGGYRHNQRHDFNAPRSVPTYMHNKNNGGSHNSGTYPQSNTTTGWTNAIVPGQIKNYFQNPNFNPHLQPYQISSPNIPIHRPVIPSDYRPRTRSPSLLGPSFDYTQTQDDSSSQKDDDELCPPGETRDWFVPNPLFNPRRPVRVSKPPPLPPTSSSDDDILVLPVTKPNRPPPVVIQIDSDDAMDIQKRTVSLRPDIFVASDESTSDSSFVVTKVVTNPQQQQQIESTSSRTVRRGSMDNFVVRIEQPSGTTTTMDIDEETPKIMEEMSDEEIPTVFETAPASPENPFGQVVSVDESEQKISLEESPMSPPPSDQDIVENEAMSIIESERMDDSNEVTQNENSSTILTDTTEIPPLLEQGIHISTDLNPPPEAEPVSSSDSHIEQSFDESPASPDENVDQGLLLPPKIVTDVPLPPPCSPSPPPQRHHVEENESELEIGPIVDSPASPDSSPAEPDQIPCANSLSEQEKIPDLPSSSPPAEVGEKEKMSANNDSTPSPHGIDKDSGVSEPIEGEEKTDSPEFSTRCLYKCVPSLDKFSVGLVNTEFPAEQAEATQRFSRIQNILKNRKKPGERRT